MQQAGSIVLLPLAVLCSILLHPASSKVIFVPDLKCNSSTLILFVIKHCRNYSTHYRWLRKTRAEIATRASPFLRTSDHSPLIIFTLGFWASFLIHRSSLLFTQGQILYFGTRKLFHDVASSYEMVTSHLGWCNVWRTPGFYWFEPVHPLCVPRGNHECSVPPTNVHV
jgi:hypothetical protein